MFNLLHTSSISQIRELFAKLYYLMLNSISKYIRSPAKTGYWLGVCHAWCHSLHVSLSQAVRHAKKCENNKMKNYYPKTLPPAYWTGTLTDFAMEPLELFTFIGKLFTHTIKTNYDEPWCHRFISIHSKDFKQIIYLHGGLERIIWLLTRVQYPKCTYGPYC